MFLYPLLCIPFTTIQHKCAYDTLSGEVVFFEQDLLYDIVKILALNLEGKISSKAFFKKYFSEKRVSDEDYRAALQELKSYQDQGVFLEDSYTYSQEAVNLKFLLQDMKRRYRKRQANTTLTLNITHACNLRCRYCHFTGIAYTGNRSHSSQSMSLVLAKKLITKFLDRTRNNTGSRHITFYGGEPLLEFEKIRDLVRYAKKEKRRLKNKARQLVFRVITNGVLITNDIIAFCIKNKIQMQISIDGPQAVHDKNRVTLQGKGSFKRVMNNIRRIKRISEESRCPNYFNKYVSFNVTNFHQTSQEAQAVAVFFSRSSVFKKVDSDRISFNIAGTNSLKGEYKEKQKLLNAQADKMSLEYLKTWKIRIEKEKSLIKKKLDIYYSDRESVQRKKKAKVFLSEIAKTYESILLPRAANYVTIRAMAGTCDVGLHKPLVDCDGKVYICTQVSLNKTTMVGESGVVDFEKIEKILRAHVLKTGRQCRSCMVFPFCNYCVTSSADDNGKLKFTRDSRFCRQMKERIVGHFSFIYSMIEAYPEFERFIRKEFRKVRNKE